VTEIESFNALMSEAKLRGFLLNKCCQLDSGAFRANWRREGKFFNCVENALPFVALRDSFLLAMGEKMVSAPPASFEDVFG
jgi:hypothetical protein